ncbi:MAG: bifunctional DNA primase/polymerase [Rhodospirillales bacterium]|nr:bifunctional DNA primase/polymerase [Rhodospirillales bacterium]
MADSSTGIFATYAGDYASRGLRVFPVGGEDGKIPQIKGWPEWATTQPENWMIGKFPDANIGVLDGVGITRVDIDDPELFDCALARFGPTPLVAQTPSGGSHLWYRSNGEYRATRLEDMKIDILGKGGFGVAPPSIRPGLGNYSFRTGGVEDIGRLPNIRRSALPDWIFVHPDERRTPTKLKPSGKKIADMVERDGRNGSLFRSCLRLAKGGEANRITFAQLWLKIASLQSLCARQRY